MKLFTLRSVIDDVLLMIRNNNVSESEDFEKETRKRQRRW